MLSPSSHLRSLLILAAAVIFLYASAMAQPSRESKSGFVSANGIRLNYLDWGGRGEVIVLLAGLGSDAHVFDEFAPHLTDRFHVIGLTRRGFGESDKPSEGYDIDSRVLDLKGFLDALGLGKVILVGHSAAGDEMTLFATLYPRRVTKLVYLEAAYTRTHLADLILADPASSDLSKRLVLEAIGSSQAAKYPLKEEQPEDMWAIYKAMYRSLIDFRPDYTRVRAPILAFFATPDRDPNMPKDPDAATRRRWDEWWNKHSQPFDKASRGQLKRQAPNAMIVEISNASHMIFQQPSEDEVIRRMKQFLAE